jgi:hypothetical protein
MNEVYEVKLQAATLSIFNQNKLQISESTTPRQVSSPQYNNFITIFE